MKNALTGGRWAAPLSVRGGRCSYCDGDEHSDHLNAHLAGKWIAVRGEQGGVGAVLVVVNVVLVRASVMPPSLHT